MSGRAHLWLLLPAAAVASLWLGWRGLATADFLYPAWYRVLDVHGHIQHYAPRNRYRDGFASTTPAERQRLFAAIVDAIHAGGRGLAELEYHDAAGRPLDRLLREPEVQHLEDVSRLVRVLAPAGWLAVAWTALHLALIRARRWSVPTMSRLLAASLASVTAGVALVLVIGPVPVFYALHEWIFPPDRPWFFYYQDSLLTTMMKAPDLFGAIAAEILAVALLLYTGILFAARRLGGSDRTNAMIR